MSISSAAAQCRLLQANMADVVLGKDELVELMIVTLMAGEHILLEDVPGVGKTLAAKSLAKSLQVKFSRLQFTPDLLPSDITGGMIFRSETSQFEFMPGPIFANIILADEINRAPPRTQAALLEAMSEGQVSIDGVTHPLPQPFMVIATQNPYEYEGTYALPESQLDRFLFRTSIGYPHRAIELRVLNSHRGGEPVDHLKSVLTGEQVQQAKANVGDVRFDESLADYLLDIVEATRRYDGFSVGVSTRGALSFYRGCQARALVQGRDFVTPDDIKSIAVEALSHRVMSEGILHGDQRRVVEHQIADLVASITVPV